MAELINPKRKHHLLDFAAKKIQIKAVATAIISKNEFTSKIAIRIDEAINENLPY